MKKLICERCGRTLEVGDRVKVVCVGKDPDVFVSSHHPECPEPASKPAAARRN